MSVGASKIYLVVSGFLEVRVGAHKTVDLIWDGGMCLLEKPSPFFSESRIWCKLITDSSYYEISIAEITNCTDPETLTNFFDYLSWRSCRLYSRWLALCENNAYQEVKYLIEWLMLAPSKAREEFSVISFIIKTSKVSRSHALAIIKALKYGEYIETREGFIVKMLKLLPERY